MKRRRGGRPRRERLNLGVAVGEDGMGPVADDDGLGAVAAPGEAEARGGMPHVDDLERL